MKALAERYHPEDSSSYVYTPEGRIRTSVSGSQVDGQVRLYLFGKRLFSMLVLAVVLCMGFTFFRIVEAFASGRVHQILDMIQKAGR